MRKYLLKPDPHDERDLLFEASQARKLPSAANLADRMSPVVDQGQLGSCTSNAMISGLREYLVLQSGQPLTRLSRLFHYWHERALEGTIDEDSGAYIRDGMKTLQKIGVCPETDYPYDINRFTDKPTAQAEKDAAPYKIAKYHRVTSLQALKSAIAHGDPVVIGISVYESFESSHVALTGRVPVPDTAKEQLLGGHALLSVGYDDYGFGTAESPQPGHVIVRNSWGEGWGIGGYCYISYEFFTTKGLVSDMWVGR